ncbi:hypothetical protein [Microbaculum marinum]|uniref:Transmembrane protein n=1 Tax=Microbaculum marinum TaxID=1764581 RepID=A0AAW9S529_9HYPH
MRSFNVLLLAAAFVLVAVTIAMEADTGLGVFAIPAIGFLVALAFLPFVPFGVLSRRAARTVSVAICTLALLLLAAVWIWGIGSVFWWNDTPHARDGLVFVVLPAYMIAASGMVAAGIWAIERYL